MLNNLLLGQTAEEKLYVEDVFSTYLYTGNGSTQTITNGIDLAGKGGMVWIKNRSNLASNIIVDTVRNNGPSSPTYPYGVLITNSTESQGTTTNLESGFFNNGGFNLFRGHDTFNTSSYTYASWTFRKAAKFFDCVTWTGNGANRTISHALGVVPGLILVKRTNAASDWCPAPLKLSHYCGSKGGIWDGSKTAFG